MLYFADVDLVYTDERVVGFRCHVVPCVLDVRYRQKIQENMGTIVRLGHPVRSAMDVQYALFTTRGWRIVLGRRLGLSLMVRCVSAAHAGGCRAEWHLSDEAPAASVTVHLSASALSATRQPTCARTSYTGDTLQTLAFHSP
jgi:hypothetical protein